MEIRFGVKMQAILCGQPRALAELTRDASTTKDAVTGWYLSTWLGGQSKACSAVRLDKDGCGSVRLAIRDGDPDCIKLTLSFATSPSTDGGRCGPRLCAFASGALPIEALPNMVTPPSGGPGLSTRAPAQFIQLGASAQTPENPNDPPGAVGQLNDPQNPDNGALVLFTDQGTDFKRLTTLRCARSCVRDSLTLAIPALQKLNTHIKSFLDSGTVSPDNLGTLFYGSLTTSGPLFPISFGLFTVPFKQCDSPLDHSHFVFYNLLQAVNNSGLSFKEALALPDEPFRELIVEAVAKMPTCCDRTMPYCSDLGLDASGLANQTTEDISRPLDYPSMVVKGATTPYTPEKEYTAEQFHALPLDKLIKLTAAAKAAQAQGNPPMGVALEADDCENLAGTILQICKGYRVFGTRFPTPLAVKKELTRTMAANPRLFGRLTTPDLEAASTTLSRVCSLFTTPHTRAHSCSSLGGTKGIYSGPVLDAHLAVVTAKGPSYNPNDTTGGGGLCGHGAALMQHVLPDGKCVHRALEGTSWLAYVPTTTCRTAQDGSPSKIPLKLADGTVAPMDVATLGTCLGQGLYSILGVSPMHRIEGKLLPMSMDTKTSPFYHSVFFSGLSYDDSALGSMAFDASANPDKPLFGAPVLGLGKDTSLAVPITPDLLSDDPATAQQALLSIKAHTSEGWPPPASPQHIETMVSFYAPVRMAPSVHSLTGGISAKDCVCGQFSVAFDNPMHREAVAALYARVADSFNKLNRADPKSDGAVMTATPQFSSCTVRVFLPVDRLYAAATQLSPKEGIALTTLRNVRQVVAEMGIQSLICTPPAPPVSTQAQARVGARVRTDTVTDTHLFHRTGRGGLRHVHRYTLA